VYVDYSQASGAGVALSWLKLRPISYPITVEFLEIFYFSYSDLSLRIRSQTGKRALVYPLGRFLPQVDVLIYMTF
jgi:hypothetical protein